MNFFFENLSLLPETRVPKEHFKLLFGSGNSDLAKIRPLKNWHPPDFLSGFALWNFASLTLALLAKTPVRTEVQDWTTPPARRAPLGEGCFAPVEEVFGFGCS